MVTYRNLDNTLLKMSILIQDQIKNFEENGTINKEEKILNQLELKAFTDVRKHLY